MTDAPLIMVRGPMPPAALAGLRQHFPLLEVSAAASELDTMGLGQRSAIRAIATLSTHGASDAVMALLPNLEMVSIFGVGADAVDLPAAKRRNVIVTNTPGVLTDDTADYAIALVFALARRIAQGDRFVRAGQWGKTPFPNALRIRGRKLGIVGMGRIGASAAAQAKALGMDVHWTGPRLKPDLPYTYHDSVTGLAETVDFLVLTCPGGPETEGIIDRKVLAALGPEGFLVNISRGTVVDQPALVDALLNNTIAGAALDVFLNEPEVPPELLDLDNVILEPHIASATVETRGDIGNLMLNNLLDYFAGRALRSRLA